MGIRRWFFKNTRCHVCKVRFFHFIPFHSTQSNYYLFRAILLHPNNVSFFILSAGWEFEQIGNVDSARAIFQAGLRVNPKSRLLWQEYYKFELLALEKIRQRQELLLNNNLDQCEIEQKSVNLIACFKSVPQIVYKNGCEALGDDFEFRIALLLLSKKFGELFANDYGFIIQE